MNSVSRVKTVTRICLWGDVNVRKKKAKFRCSTKNCSFVIHFNFLQLHLFHLNDKLLIMAAVEKLPLCLYLRSGQFEKVLSISVESFFAGREVWKPL